MREMESCRRVLVETIKTLVPEGDLQNWAINFVDYAKGVSKERFFCLIQALEELDLWELEAVLMKWWMIENEEAL